MHPHTHGPRRHERPCCKRFGPPCRPSGLGQRAQILIVGSCALIWLLLRSGLRPNRMSYPCQQSALGLAVAAFGAPVVGVTMASRQWILSAARLPWVMVLAALAAGVGVVFVTLGSAAPPPAAALGGPPGYRAEVYSVPNVRGPTADRFGGVDDLVSLLGVHGTRWYRSVESSLDSGPDGIVGADDVVLIKINGQWAERGGTNTDVLRGILRAIVEHPDGFTGEIVVADNGQGSGSFLRDRNNAEDITQTTADVVDEFRAEGWRASTFLWDTIRTRAAREYVEGDIYNGYVLGVTVDPQTLIRVSYPKFQTAFGTFVSYKNGVWNAALSEYEDRLTVINVPVLKTHSIYGITSAVKNHMGVITQSQGTDSHNGVGRGGLGSVLAEVRMPDLTILDCVWVLARPGAGPSSLYGQASRRDQLAASRDPVALDIWAAKSILVPEILNNGFDPQDYFATQDPDNPESIFRRYLDRSLSELLAAGIAATNDPGAIDVHTWAGDLDRDGDIDLPDAAGFSACLGGPDAPVDPTCGVLDADADDDLDLRDWATMHTVFGARGSDQ